MSFTRLGALALCASACSSVVTTSAPDAGDPIIDAPIAVDTPIATDVAVVDAAVSIDVPAPDVVPVDAGAPDVFVPADLGPTDPSRIVSMSISSSHECAVFADGHVRCRGANYRGQLGIGSTDFLAHRSTVVPGLRGARQVVANNGYATHTLQDDGTVRAWGSNSFDALGVRAPPDVCESEPCAQRPVMVAGASDAVSLVASIFGVCVLRRDRTLLCWGSTYINGSRHPTPEVEDDRGDIRDLAMASVYVVARRTDGSLLPGLGRTVFGESIPTEWEIAPTRGAHLCAALSDRTLRCWGSNHYGQVGDGTVSERGDREPGPRDPGLTSVRSAAAGDFHTCAIRDDRTLWCWGSNGDQQTGVPLGESESCPGLSRPGPCVRRPRQVAGIDNVESVYLGYSRTCAVRTDHTLWCWGRPFGPTAVSSPVPARADW